jgi:hypothetical protein
MELWQMDVMGRVFLSGGVEVKAVTGIDDHSRFIVCAKVAARATARPVCLALAEALARHGVPGQILTGNGKVFTARSGTGPGPVMFDRICADNGIWHLLTAPYSPTTTGKVERAHKTMRAEFFTRAGGTLPGIGELQAALDAWVTQYNTARPHQSCGGRVTRLADSAGVVSFAGTPYSAGRRWARQPLDVSIVAGSVQLSRDGKVIRVHPIRHDRSRELGAFANPKGRPRRKNSAVGNVA